MSKLNATQYDAIFFSPHLDDAVLSCGGLITRLTNQRKKVLVVTLFTSGQEIISKSQDLKNFLKQSAVKNSQELFTKRRKEDKSAARLLGFNYLHLGYIDALWRTNQTKPLYPNFRQIFSGKISAADKKLAEEITVACTEIVRQNKSSAIIYVPLAIGQHVDHVLTFQTIKSVCFQFKKQLLFWEDVPYRDHVGAREKRFAQLKTIPKYSLISCSSTETLKKEKACALYKTQITWLKKAGLGTMDNQREGFFEL